MQSFFMEDKDCLSYTTCIVSNMAADDLEVQGTMASAAMVQWNLYITTTSKIKLLPVIYSVMCFNEDWMYQVTLANNFCLLELI